MLCPHGGMAQGQPTTSALVIDGAVPLLASDPIIISGCPSTGPDDEPTPCLWVQWVDPACSVTISGQPALCSASTGLCVTADGVPQGPIELVSLQTRVVG